MLGAEQEKYSDDKNRLRDNRLKNKEKQETLIQTAHVIMKHFKFLTLEDTEEILFYDKIWNKEGKTTIKQICHNLNDKFSVNDINEIIAKIRILTYKKRDILNPSHLIGFENCVLDLNTWEIIKHNPKNYLTKIIPVNYEPGMFPNKFEKFLDKVILEEDKQLALELMSHCLISDYRFQKAFVLLGGGDNGKTTFLNVLIAFLGDENISSLTLQNFEKNQFAASQLFGKMANIADDISKKGLRETQTFKILTGNGYGTHNVKGTKAITFKNIAKLIFSCNELPPIYEDTHAIWRRLCVINFEKVIPLEDQIKDLDKKLTTKEELSGILNILLFSLKRLIDRGNFEGLVSVLDTRKQYIKKSDLIHAFCDNCLEYEEHNWLSTEELFREMCLYAEAIKQEPRTKKSLADRIMMYKPKIYRNYGIEDNKKVRGYRGLRIVDWRKQIEN